MKYIVRIVFICVFLGLFPSRVHALECESIICSKSETATSSADFTNFNACIQQKRSCLEGKIAQIQGQKSTLNSAISVLTSKITIQEIQIAQTQAEINKLEREISGLSELITGLNLSLDRLSSLLVERVKEQYKQTRVAAFTQLLDSESFADFFGRIQYLERASDQTAVAMERAELKRIVYDQQKELKETKQTEVENKKKEIVKQKTALDAQKKEQQELLRVTNNDEVRYQQLLAEAVAQVASFKSFVSTAGGSVIDADGLGKGYDGAYFSQRDKRWAYAQIGRSSENIYNVGCLVTSIAMALKAKGVDVSPLTIASNASYFFYNTAYMLSRSTVSLPGGKSSHKIAVSSINSELEGGNGVIAGLKAGPYGTHFVLLKKKDGQTWTMYDPWYGPDLPFTSHYKSSQIYSAEVIN